MRNNKEQLIKGKTLYTLWRPEELNESDSFSSTNFKTCERGQYPDAETFMTIPYTGNSSVQGSAIYVANFETIEESHAELFETKQIVRVYGIYDSQKLYVRLDTPDDNPIWETISALENYPILDENRMSELEMDRQNEAWDYWVAGDFRRELKRLVGTKFDKHTNFCNIYQSRYNKIHKRINAVYRTANKRFKGVGYPYETLYPNERYEYSKLWDKKHNALDRQIKICRKRCTVYDELLDDVSDDKLFEFFQQLCERTNTYWREESDGGQHIDIHDVVRDVTVFEIREFVEG